ncbi:hypothetical protein [Halopiger goleimassiliensis]|uniref:hypothetical protein n=1 Tax=Halopiger goleimassiliensis TaxID=1293048 RepID=UPI0006779E12|nr:hypothetical protein [Halopiger goleimassiliensis]
MVRFPRWWFRDADGEWTIPSGRRGELLVLLIGLPAFAGFVSAESGLPTVGNRWPIVAAGVWCGFLYASRMRDRLAERFPNVDVWTVVSVVVGGMGLSVLELLPTSGTTTIAILSTSGTVLAIYLLRAASPLHDGLAPPARGVEPPTDIESGRR